ncbi:outer-membrane receptor for ferric coprogen and ferric-rhodotorulic acid [Paracoccus aminovorans]|uniref:Outer-membrane receptor for ferric coprogen and ferric-rhodotorulic acid n=1 Tax=Paracoccus aminovorans TaxID=34004 RepID=A0A1I2ZSN1_9RHOB|nr:TonB-dependent receptor [Paracoccus aminovorans]CQR84102.1 TonB-denpendent receptor [Paracoccus aminovorans]SFH40625.1 outer-membrane receptor for ferric coprogen and ferric-rhodotorulic acid [Paracoccus aminovorans]
MNFSRKSAAGIGRTLLVVLLCSPAPATLAQAQDRRQEQVYRFDIPARPVAEAANRIGAVTGLSVVIRENRRTAVQANPVHGIMSAQQALTRLLAGTGLSHRIDGTGTVVIEPAAAPAAAAESGAVVLETVTLATSAPGTTEGTHSYTTDVATGATGLPLTLKETPQSVSVVTSQRMADQGLQTTQQVLAYTTGVNSSTYETDRDNTWARGQWVSSYIIDGVLVDAGWGFFAGTGVQSSTAAYDHVEVIRGASGLLTGTGDPAAAVRITRKQADARELTGSVETRYGTWNRFGATLDVQSPLNAQGSLRGRLVADLYSGDWFRDRYHVDKQTVYGTLAWDVTPDTMLTFSLEHRNHDPSGSEWAGWPSMFSDGSLTHFPRGFSSAPWWTSWSGKQDLATARIDHDFGNGWTADATLSLMRKTYTAEHMRFYGQPDPVTGEGLQPFAQKDKVDGRQIALDAQVGGPLRAFGREHALNFGFHGGREWSRQTIYTPAAQPVIGSVFDWIGDMARPDWVLDSRGGWDLGATQYAVYGSARVSLADPLTAILGLRYTDWKSDDRHFTEPTPYVGLVYAVTPDLSVYASYTSIFNPQQLKDRNGDYLDPVQGKNKEIGVKGAWMDDRLNASLSWYHTYQDNVAEIDEGHFLPGGEQAYIGRDGVSAKGVEFEISGEIRPGLNLFFGAATMKQRNPDGSQAMTSLPTRSAKVFATWNLPGRWEKWTVGGGARWQNRTWTDVYVGGNPIRLDRAGYTVADAMVRYDIDERWSAQLNLNNVFDKTYFTGAANIATYGEPRNAMLTLVSRF